MSQNLERSYKLWSKLFSSLSTLTSLPQIQCREHNQSTCFESLSEPFWLKYLECLAWASFIRCLAFLTWSSQFATNFCVLQLFFRIGSFKMIPMIAIDWSSLQYDNIGFTLDNALHGCLFSEPYLSNATCFPTVFAYVQFPISLELSNYRTILRLFTSI